ncbi:acyl-CoA thioesterase [Iodidimonas nitroreducens]|uniref:Acyl-CoA thioesterase n=1 Tax=Iodidimonas nitroreducens TaxID=1236968 RepID=A0A5A7N5E4_9PROT|nr:acyl-CoA thioesterase [Iodidimonas nitroreducens]GAK32399.1 acyl-CoA thioester hydrolase YciA [alpha proteobacterium Q-1]GER03197.1 acyl-CoA thioesterase [Iodidimonas nitroreducens]
MTIKRDPIIRTAPRLADLNLNGHIFGGWLLSQMDVAGGITASKRAKGAVATVAIEGMKFHRPVHVGDLISCYADIKSVGRTSMHISVEVCVTRRGIEEEFTVTEGTFIFVAVDSEGRPRPVDQPD